MHYSEYPHRAAQQRMRALIWRLSDDLKVYRANPTARRRGELRPASSASSSDASASSR